MPLLLSFSAAAYCPSTAELSLFSAADWGARAILGCQLLSLLSLAATCVVSFYCRWFAATWVASYYSRCPLLLLPLSFAATWVASYYCRCPLLLPELTVTIVAVLCCYLSWQLLLALSFAATYVASYILSLASATTWVAFYNCHWHLLPPSSQTTQNSKWQQLHWESSVKRRKPVTYCKVYKIKPVAVRDVCTVRVLRVFRSLDWLVLMIFNFKFFICAYKLINKR